MTKTVNLSEYLLKLSDYQKKRINVVCGECPKRFDCYVKGVVENDDYKDVVFRRRAIVMMEMGICPADPQYYA